MEALKIHNIKGEDTGKTVELNKSVFGIKPNEHSVYLLIKGINNNSRQGTHSTKERGKVKGSTKKLRKQKGSGMARYGDIKNPIFRGGGVTFGPRSNRDYSIKVNKKTKSLARSSVLSWLNKNNLIVGLENFDFDKPKTKEYKEVLKNLKLDEVKTCMIVEKDKKNIYLSSRNLTYSKVMSVEELNIKNIISCKKVVITEKALEYLNNTKK